MIKIKKIRSKRKTLSLQINSNFEVILRIPYCVTDLEAKKFLLKHKKWLEEKLEILKEKKNKWKKIEFKKNEIIPYRGYFYKIEMVNGQNKPIIINENEKKLYFSSNIFEKYKKKFIEDGKIDNIEWKSEIIKKYLLKFFKEELKKLILSYCVEYSKNYNFEYKNIKINSSKKRWGSCTSKGNLNFSFRLIFVPDSVLRYVIVHELVHLRIRNHKKIFWKNVEKIFPAYKKSKNWLKENSYISEII